MGTGLNRILKDKPRHVNQAWVVNYTDLQLDLAGIYEERKTKERLSNSFSYRFVILFCFLSHIKPLKLEL